MNKEDLLNINGGDNKKDFKKILIYGAVVFLIFVIGVIGFAIYKNTTSSKEESILPPQVKQEPLFKQLPIEKNKTVNTNVNQNENQKSNKNNNTNAGVTTPTSSKPAVKPEENIKEKILHNTQNNNTQNIIQKTEQPSQIKPVKIRFSKTKHQTAIKGNYYIQVAALLKYSRPNKKFLKLIKKYGYNYRFYTTYIKKDNQKIRVTKILIGPFNSRVMAEKNLLKVKKYITQNAFIFKVK